MLLSKVKVALTSEDNRYRTVFRALDAIFPELSEKVLALDPRNDYILIKPNCINTKNVLAVTDVEALKAVLDYLTPLWHGRVVLAEGSGLGETMEAFKNFKYLDLEHLFPKLEFVDTNFGESITLNIFDSNLKPMPVKIAKIIAEAPLRISVGPTKTHESVMVTLSIKNMAVGAILKEDKSHIHQGPRAINRSIVELNKKTFPHIAVLDGWISMEGNGPVDGTPLATHFAICSGNALAADVLATELMGFNPVEIGYLNLLGAEEMLKNLQIIGEDKAKLQFHFKFPKNYQDQLEWI